MNELGRWTNRVLEGDVLDRLGDLPESSVHMAMCSPPYFGLRDYGVDGQIGLEDSIGEYVRSLVDVGDELLRVLRPDGSWWLNLGDSYGGDSIIRSDGQWTRPGDDGYEEAHTAEYGDGRRSMSTLGRKNKLLVPHRVAIALQESGWVVRNDAVWKKPNPMPESVTDRLAQTFEYVFHLTPGPDYWYDLDRIREPHAEASINRSGRHDHTHRDYPNARPQTLDPDQFVHPNGKNPGDIFEVTVKPFPEAHFAVYPEELCETPILATAPERVCSDCGTPYERETTEADPLTNPRDREQKAKAIEWFERSELTEEHLKAVRSVGITDADYGQETQWGVGRNLDETEQLAAEAQDVLGSYAREFISPDRETVGWAPGCGCGSEATKPGIVLDPFAGAGTTLKVAKRLGRRFIGIELNPEFVAMAQKRVGVDVDQPELLEGVADDQSPLAAFAADGGDRR